jgi:hypothetical protein
MLTTLFDPEAAEVVLEPESTGPGFWVGAPSVCRAADGTVLLTYRRRRPRGHPAGDRGYVACIAASTDGRSFRDVARLPKEALGTTSIERTALLPDPRRPGGWLWLVSYVDPGDGRWRIDALRAGALQDLPAGERTAVLTAADIGGEGVKDPVPLRAGGRVWLFLSCAARPEGGVPPERLHGTHDVYNTGLTKAFTGLASSADGVAWSWHGPCLLPGSGWDRYQARLGTVVPVGPAWIGLYDGSASVEENYEERLGVAWSRDLAHWERLTPEGPAVLSRGRTGSVRYADVLPMPEGLWVYAECSRPDGAHDLRLMKLPFKA